MTPDFSPEAIAALTQSELAERRRYVESRSARDHWSAAELELIDREARWIATVDKLRDHLPDQEHNEQAIRALHAQAAQLLAALGAERVVHAETAWHWEIDRTLLDAANARHAAAEAALEASERENERLLAALRRIAGLGMNPRHPGASYEIAAAALTPSTPPDLREDA